jgi:uncharacterized protein (DUF433 family)
MLRYDSRKPELKSSYMIDLNLVVSDPKIMMGKPVITGTRITVELILEKLAAGETAAEIIAAHPRLTPAAIFAALTFATAALKADVIYPVLVTNA